MACGSCRPNYRMQVFGSFWGFLMKKSSFLQLQHTRARCHWSSHHRHPVDCQRTNKLHEKPCCDKRISYQSWFSQKLSHHQQAKPTATLPRHRHIRPTTAASIGRAGKLIIRVSQRQAPVTNANYIKKKKTHNLENSIWSSLADQSG